MLDEKWTGRMTPGLADLAGSPDLINKHIMKLINFAKDALDGEEDNWYNSCTTSLFDVTSCIYNTVYATLYTYMCIGPITRYF